MATQRRKWSGGRTADWLPKTRPGIVSRTADGAYGEHLRNRTPGVRSRAVLAGETFEVWARRIGAQDTPYWRSWYLQDKQSRGLMMPEEQTNYLKKQGWSNNWLSNYPRLPQSTIPTPAVEYPAPGRPPKYNNPFAWRRKNNGWW